MKADKYYGAAATGYEAGRAHTKRWKEEQAGVDWFVTEGPVLDVPIGTGRYVPIYKRKGLTVIGLDISVDMRRIAAARHPDINIMAGTIFDMPFQDGAVGTAVCTRMLDWLLPDEMAAAVAELRRVARTLVLTIRLGEPEIRVNQTHSVEDFAKAIAGMLVEGRRHTETTRDGVEELIKLRQPTWNDVRREFLWHGSDGTPEGAMQRLAGEWAGRLLAVPVMITADSVSISAERWSPAKMDAAIAGHCAFDHRYRINAVPRDGGGYPIILEAARPDGGMAHVILDGRHRFNEALRAGLERQVLVLRPRL